MVYVILGTGFEEMEALASVDVLRRAGVSVKTAAVGERETVGAHGITVTADCKVADVSLDDMTMLVLPGGMGGVESIMNDAAAMALVKTAHEAGKDIAAICAAPMILAKLGYAAGRRMVIYPGMEEYIPGAEVPKGVKTCVDGEFITGLGPGAAIDFGLELVRRTAGDSAADTVRAQLHY